MDVQDDVAGLVDLRCDVENDAGRKNGCTVTDGEVWEPAVVVVVVVW